MHPLELHVLSGARSGEVIEIVEERAIVGRSPEAGLRFDPVQDLEVSRFHAEISRRGDAWYVRDLDSRNGTWLDGTRVEGDRRLRSGGRLQFGTNGPEVQVRLAADPAPDDPPPTYHGPPPVPRPQPTPSARIRTLTTRNRTLARALVGGLALAAVVGTVVAYAWVSRDLAFRQERDALRSDMDRLLEASHRAIERLQGEMEGLAAVLRDSEEEVRRLRSALDAAEEEGGDPAAIADLRLRLQAATVALTRHQLAASLDFAAIERANRGAVALLYVELRPGVVSTATAFAVRSDGTLLTNRHVVAGPDGTAEPVRIGVQFSDSPQVWPGRVVRVSPETDLALIRVANIIGDVPTVAGFNQRQDTVAPGSPVALLGFPLGGEGGPEVEGRTVPRALLTAGVVQTRVAGTLEVVGYGEQGASGSPVLDALGQVLGVLYGGSDRNGTWTLLAVPAADALRFLGDDLGDDLRR